MRLRPRVALTLLAVAVLATLMVSLGLGESSPPSGSVAGPVPVPVPVMVPIPIPRTDVVVKSIRGKIEIQRRESWDRAEAGDRLSEDQAIRTGPNARATLIVGDTDTQIAVRERSKVSILQVTDNMARVRLERGRLAADLNGNRLLKVESRGSSTVAEAKRGRFSVFNSGKGLVAVAAETAEIRLKTAGGHQLLAAGEQAVIEGNQPPSTERISQAVFLSVIWPEARRTRADSLTVRGMANPRSEVLVNRKPVAVGLDGTFTAEIALAEGANPVEIKTTDILGHTKRARRTIQVRRKGPKVRANSDALWK